MTTTSLPPWPSRNNKRSSAAPTPSSSINTTTTFTTTTHAKNDDEDDHAHNHSDLAEAPELSDVVASISLLVHRFYGRPPPPPSGHHHQQQQGGGGGSKKRKRNSSSGNSAFHACPLVLHHQLYTVLEDQTAVDMEIENLRRQNFVRLLRLLTLRQDVGVLLTSTYLARVQAAIDLYTASLAAQQQEQQQQQLLPQENAKLGKSEQGAATKDGGTSSMGAAAAAAAAVAAAEEMVFALSFFRKAVRAFTTLSVTRQQLESLMTTSLLQQKGRRDHLEEEDEEEGAAAAADGYPLKVPSSLLRNQKSTVVADMMPEAAAAVAAAAVAAAVAAAKGTKCTSTSKSKSKNQGKQKGSSTSTTFTGPCLDLAIRQLLKIGFLARRVDSRLEEAYWFSAPEIGRITASLPHGRKAILAALGRSRYKELLERNLQEVDLKQSMLPHSFHLADLVGSKEVLAVETAAGTFLRLPPGALARGGGGGGGGGGARRR